MRSRAPRFEILHEDDHLIALVKPAGLPTANAPAGTDSVFTLLGRAGPPGSFLGVVSRLDAPVSGVLVMAKTRAAAADLSEQFRSRSVNKRYIAVVEGRFPAPLGRWDDWHDTIAPPDSLRPGDRRAGRGLPHARRGTAADAPDAGGRPAHVRARVVRRAGEVSLVELEPSTGRRHQLRQQLSRRGCPIVGDRRYGSRIPLAEGVIALHAAGLSLDHPATGARLSLEAPGPAEWRERFPALFASRYR